MGVLSDFNERVEESTRRVLDNDRFSVQDTTRGGIQRAAGHEGDEDEFARDSARTFDRADRVIATPGRKVGEATEGTAAKNKYTTGAVRGGEAAYNLLVKDTAGIAYGTATGADVRGEAEHATGGYAPDAMEAGELAIIASTGGGAAVAKGGVKAAAKGGGKAASKARKATDGAQDMGILKMASRGVRKATGRSAKKASDEGVRTSRKQASAYKHRPSKSPERLKTPDHQVGKSAAGSIKQAASSSKNYLKGAASKKSNKAIGVGALGLGAMGVVGGDKSFPQGYTQDERYDAAPGGWRVKETNNDGTLVGYWVVVETNDGATTVLLPQANSYRTAAVSFPTNREAPFDSAAQANHAYSTWAERVRDPENGEAAWYAEDDPEPNPSGWGNVTVLKPLQQGWVLAEQSHHSEERYRYLVAGRSPQDELLFLGPSGTARSTMHTFSSTDRATSAYEQWLDAYNNSNVSAAPDTAQQTPSGDEIGSKAGDTGGSLGLVKMAGMGGAVAALALVLYKVIL